MGRIIGLSAKKQGGKTTVTEFVSESFKRYNLLGNVHVLMFSEELKRIVLNCFVPYEWKWTIKDLDLDDNKNRVTPCGKTVRKLLQIVGTDMFRSIWNPVWINPVINKIKKLMKEDEDSLIVVNDVRFPNELETIHNLGGIVIRMTRAPFAGQDEHESEIVLDETHQLSWEYHYDPQKYSFLNPNNLFDFFIENHECPLDETQAQVESILGLEGII